MNIEEIKTLVELLENSSLCELKYKNEEGLLHIKKPSANETVMPAIYAAPPITGEATSSPSSVCCSAENGSEKVCGAWVRAPFVGVFYSAPSENSSPFIKIGQKVKKGDTLCILEAMKVMNEIKAPVDGIIKDIKPGNGKLVEYDEEMILIGE